MPQSRPVPAHRTRPVHAGPPDRNGWHGAPPDRRTPCAVPELPASPDLPTLRKAPVRRNILPQRTSLPESPHTLPSGRHDFRRCPRYTGHSPTWRSRKKPAPPAVRQRLRSQWRPHRPQTMPSDPSARTASGNRRSRQTVRSLRSPRRCTGSLHKTYCRYCREAPQMLRRRTVRSLASPVIRCRHRSLFSHCSPAAGSVRQRHAPALRNPAFCPSAAQALPEK